MLQPPSRVEQRWQMQQERCLDTNCGRCCSERASHTPLESAVPALWNTSVHRDPWWSSFRAAWAQHMGGLGVSMLWGCSRTSLLAVEVGLIRWRFLRTVRWGQGLGMLWLCGLCARMPHGSAPWHVVLVLGLAHRSRGVAGALAATPCSAEHLANELCHI